MEIVNIYLLMVIFHSYVKLPKGIFNGLGNAAGRPFYSSMDKIEFLDHASEEGEKRADLPRNPQARYTNANWLVVYLPLLKNDGVRQLGL